MTYLEKIASIESTCAKHNIPCQVRQCHDGWKILFSWCAGDIACNSLTIGCRDDLVESFCFPWDEGSVSVLTPQEAISKIIAFYFLYLLLQKKA